MTDQLSRLDTIKQKLANRSDLQIKPPLSEGKIQAFEKKHNITLPEEYRLFLKEIGNGGSGPTVYDFYPLRAKRGQHPQKPFPLTKAWVWEEEEEPDEDLMASCLSDGQLALCHQGDGEEWVLITTGPERGNLWLTTEFGVAPSTPGCSFFDWFEAWMDERQHELLADLEGEEEDSGE